MNGSKKSILSLCIISLSVALALAGTNALTSPLIEAADKEATRKALSEVYPSGADFNALDIAQYEDIPVSVTEIYGFSDGGCVVKVSTSGFNAGLVVISGINSEGKITGSKCLESAETEAVTGKREYTYGESFIGADISGIDTAPAISGATRTTEGYKRALKDTVAAFYAVTGQSGASPPVSSQG